MRIRLTQDEAKTVLTKLQELEAANAGTTYKELFPRAMEALPWERRRSFCARDKLLKIAAGETAHSEREGVPLRTAGRESSRRKKKRGGGRYRPNGSRRRSAPITTRCGARWSRGSDRGIRRGQGRGASRQPDRISATASAATYPGTCGGNPL